MLITQTYTVELKRLLYHDWHFTHFHDNTLTRWKTPLNRACGWSLSLWNMFAEVSDKKRHRPDSVALGFLFKHPLPAPHTEPFP